MRFLAVSLLSVATFAQPSNAADLLTIGSDAPVLDVEHWVQNGKGKFKPVTKFESGKTYVVEFWATWCGPCVASMPHLASLQAEYADKGVQIVSISDEDLETVEKFLEREVRGSKEEEGTEEKKQTYRDLTSAYCLTTDPDQSSYKDYMEAAAQNGIPTAFIVGKDSKVEWIGHPMSMDEPLKAVVEGTWDREKFAEEMRAEQEAQQAMQSVFALLQKQDYDAALESLDKIIEKRDDIQMQMLKLQVLIVAEKADASEAHINKLYKSLVEDAATTNMVAWNIYQMAEQGRIEKGPLVDASIKATLAAAKKAEAEEKGSVLDTVSHLQAVNGQLKEALATEKQAIELSSKEDREFMQKFLEELEAKLAEEK